MVRMDEEIKREIVDELAWNGRVDASDIKVEVQSGSVTLTGSAPTYGARTEAYLSALRIPGVLSVDNQLQVAYPGTITMPTDTEVQDNAQKALRWSPEIDSSQIKVASLAGHVTLEGTVDALWKKGHAEMLVANVAGVLSIENKLNVVRTDEIADKSTAEDIRAALDRRLGSNAPDVTVEVEDGVVTLTGTVPTWRDRDEAYNAAVYTFGVLRVDDLLTVAAEPAGAPAS